MAVEIINFHVSYVAGLGFELKIPGPAVRSATGCAMEPEEDRQKCEIYLLKS